MFSCEICEFFKNTYFQEHLETTISVNLTNIMEVAIPLSDL